mgnify:CR=1 FL=1
MVGAQAPVVVVVAVALASLVALVAEACPGVLEE